MQERDGVTEMERREERWNDRLRETVMGSEGYRKGEKGRDGVNVHDGERE